MRLCRLGTVWLYALALSAVERICIVTGDRGGIAQAGWDGVGTAKTHWVARGHDVVCGGGVGGR
jgi:hypothetical protein